MSTPAQKFTEWLASHRNGVADAELSDLLEEVVTAVARSSKKNASGSLTVKFKFRAEGDMVAITDVVSSSVPDETEPRFYYVAVDGSLSRNNPLQRMPWAKLAEAAIARNAIERTPGGSGRARGKDVVAARSRARLNSARRARADADRDPDTKRRLPVTVDRLREVVRLHEEARELKVRWDDHAAAALGCTRDHARKLYSRARREGI